MVYGLKCTRFALIMVELFVFRLSRCCLFTNICSEDKFSLPGNLRGRHLSFGPRCLLHDAMHSAVLVIVNLSVCPSVSHTRGLCSHGLTMIMISSPYRSPKILIFWRHNSSPHSNGVNFKFSVKYKRVGKMWFSALK